MKIKSKRLVKIEEPVYDITVPDTHNFLTKAGLFVHNCDHPQEVAGGWCNENRESVVPGSKDQSDAVAQIVYKIFTNPIQTNIMDLANSIQHSQGTITTQAKPLMYNLPKKPMSQREAVQKAMSLFTNRK